MDPDQPDDTERLLNRVREGEARALALLLDRHRERLRRMVALRMDRRLSRRIDPSDIVQEALISASQRLGQYLENPPVDFYPWLRRIAWQRLMDVQRRNVGAERRSVRYEAGWLGQQADLSADALAAWAADSQTAPLERLAREELRDRVRQLITQLAAIDREVLLLRYIEQLTARQAAQVLGISESALKGRQVRALERLREMLDAEFGEAM